MEDERVFDIVFAILMIAILACTIDGCSRILATEPAEPVTHTLIIANKQESGVFDRKYFVLQCDTGVFAWHVSTKEYLTHEIGQEFTIDPWNYEDLGACRNELWWERQNGQK